MPNGDPRELVRGADGLLYQLRIDPPNCGCTDCLTDRSVPLNVEDQHQLEMLYEGEYTNATGYQIARDITYRVWQ